MVDVIVMHALRDGDGKRDHWHDVLATVGNVTLVKCQQQYRSRRRSEAALLLPLGGRC